MDTQVYSDTRLPERQPFYRNNGNDDKNLRIVAPMRGIRAESGSFTPREPPPPSDSTLKGTAAASSTTSAVTWPPDVTDSNHANNAKHKSGTASMSVVGNASIVTSDIAFKLSPRNKLETTTATVFDAHSNASSDSITNPLVSPGTSACTSQLVWAEMPVDTWFSEPRQQVGSLASASLVKHTSATAASAATPSPPTTDKRFSAKGMFRKVVKFDHEQSSSHSTSHHHEKSINAPTVAASTSTNHTSHIGGNHISTTGPVSPQSTFRPSSRSLSASKYLRPRSRSNSRRRRNDGGINQDNILAENVHPADPNSSHHIHEQSDSVHTTNDKEKERGLSLVSLSSLRQRRTSAGAASFPSLKFKSSRGFSARARRHLEPTDDLEQLQPNMANPSPILQAPEKNQVISMSSSKPSIKSDLSADDSSEVSDHQRNPKNDIIVDTVDVFLSAESVSPASPSTLKKLTEQELKQILIDEFETLETV